MARTTHITETFAVSGAVSADDVARLSARGFRTLVNFRDDAEGPHLASDELARLANAHGLAYWHVPAAPAEVLAANVIDTAARAFASSDGPIVAVCATGQRAAIVWAALAAQSQPVEGVLTTLNAVGIDLSPVRDDLTDAARSARLRKAHRASASPADNPRHAA